MDYTSSQSSTMNRWRTGTNGGRLQGTFARFTPMLGDSGTGIPTTVISPLCTSVNTLFQPQVYKT